jgi:hypothetical protein
VIWLIVCFCLVVAAVRVGGMAIVAVGLGFTLALFRAISKGSDEQ